MPRGPCVFAPAKINLSLAVTGRRSDGYHLIDTVVVFADVGDELFAEPAENLTLEIEGPFGAGLSPGPDNLVMKAAKALRAATGTRAGARLRLVKRLPVASGIGGGSSDAAAALRALDGLWGLGLGIEGLRGIARRLGADVPMCLGPSAQRATGIGEILSPLEGFPELALVLANPLRPVSTREVFARVTSHGAAGGPPSGSFMGWLRTAANDLQAPACKIEPMVGEVLEALAKLPGARLCRMSGSGATCFALFDDMDTARVAAADLSASHPGWWVAATKAG